MSDYNKDPYEVCERLYAEVKELETEIVKLHEALADIFANGNDAEAWDWEELKQITEGL